MDLWVVAAATGAGYAAKYWKNLSSREQEGSSEFCFGYSIQTKTKTKTVNPLQQIQDQTFTFSRRSVPKQLSKDVFVETGIVDDIEVSDQFLKTRDEETSVKMEFCSDSFCRFTRKKGLKNNRSLNSLNDLVNHEYLSETEECSYDSVLSRCMPTVKPLSAKENSVEDSESKQQIVDRRYGRLNKNIIRESTQKFQSKGFPDGTLFVFLGITIGIMSVVVAKKEEAENLNSLLNEKLGLIRDLQEDLEMNNRFMVKEINGKGFVGLETEVDNAAKMSQIEAELEAELERLEENLKSSTFDRISDYFELNSDAEEDIVHGDLKLKNIDRESVSLSDSERDRSEEESTNQTDTPNHVLSPKDLSLRLHNVIQSRLEARITELETLLESSQKRLHWLETKSIILPSHSYSYNPEFVYEGNHKKERWSKNFVHDDHMRSWEEQTSRSWGSYENSESEEDDEIGKLLIKQIVEKTRRGSPVVLNAQRMLCKSDMNDVY